MAKRFTDTDKWKKPFIRGLQGAYKILWIYILDECDHAGIWQVDFEIAKIKIGELVTEDVALSQFRNKIRVIEMGEKWFIPDFIEFQYGELNPENRVHSSVLTILKKNGIELINGEIKPLDSPLIGAKDKEQDKVKDKDHSETKKFIKPTLNEVEDYFLKIGAHRVYKSESEKFINHFTSNGWKVGGKTPMKSWQAAVNTWWSRFKENNPNHNQESTKYKCQKDFNNYNEYESYCSEMNITPEKRELAPWELMTKL